jgi:hypothetical protein
LSEAQEGKEKFELLYNEKFGESVEAQKSLLQEKLGAESIEELVGS